MGEHDTGGHCTSTNHDWGELNYGSCLQRTPKDAFVRAMHNPNSFDPCTCLPHDVLLSSSLTPLPSIRAAQRTDGSLTVHAVDAGGFNPYGVHYRSP